MSYTSEHVSEVLRVHGERGIGRVAGLALAASARAVLQVDVPHTLLFT